MNIIHKKTFVCLRQPINCSERTTRGHREATYVVHSKHLFVRHNQFKLFGTVDPSSSKQYILFEFNKILVRINKMDFKWLG